MTTSAKKLAQEVIAELPDDATLEDVQYGLYLAELIQQRSAAADEVIKMGVPRGLESGAIVSHEDVIQRMAKWLPK